MSFIKTKLSADDKKILSEIYEELEEIILPTSYSSKGIKGHHHIDDKPKSFHIKTNSLIFNGSEIPHKSEPFKGTRYSLVFFK
jgi:hypothetical protein